MSTPELFDVHTHIQFHAFQDDADLVIRRALDAGVWVINVGTQRDTSQNAIALAEKFSEGLPAEASAEAGVYATVGLHPIHTEKSHHDAQELGGDTAFTSRGEEFDYEYYKTLAKHPNVVAIGECGLDYYRLEPETKRKQAEPFLKQVELSREVKKPLMIHCRNAFSDLIAFLQATSYQLLPNPGVVHFFSGTKDDARALLDLGFSFSFGGVLTFTRDYDEVVHYIPLDRMLLETDAPYVAPVPHRGKRNEPLYVAETAKKLAEIKNSLFEEISSRTAQNARALFKI